MEQTALRPKPMPGREPADGTTSRPVRRPHAARRRGRRLTTLLFGLFIGIVLVLAGVGLGTLGATVIGMSKLADLQRQAGQGERTGQPGRGRAHGAGRTPSPDPESGPGPDPRPERALPGRPRAARVRPPRRPP